MYIFSDHRWHIRLILSLLMIVYLPITMGEHQEKIFLGIDRILSKKYSQHLCKKNIGILTNHTGINSNLESTISMLKNNSKKYNYTVSAIFTPEHGLHGVGRNSEKIKDSRIGDIPVYSLYGNNNRPTDDMLKGIDIIVYDIQDVGFRAFTYITTLFYTMEEAAKRNIKVIIADRPNPMGGNIINGTMVDPEAKSFYSYINIPLCYGMTIGELASFFNFEYKVNCDLLIIPMKNWKRNMKFADTGLYWIPASPNMPEADTPNYYPITMLLGKLNVVSVGIGTTSPFKVIGAPWIDSDKLAYSLNNKKLSGIKFYPYKFRPNYDTYSGEDCYGVKIFLMDGVDLNLIDTQFAIFNVLKDVYPEEVINRISNLSVEQKEKFAQIVGSRKILNMLLNNKMSANYNLTNHESIKKFSMLRGKYLIADYIK